MEAEVAIGQESTKGLFWSEEEAKVVSSFLKDEPIEIAGIHSPKRNILWSKIKETIESGKRPGAKKQKEFARTPEEKNEWEYSSRERSKTIQQIAADSLRKFGIWDEKEYRRFQAISKPRQRSNFFQDEIHEPQIENFGYISAEEGGPNLISTINYPLAERTGDITDERARRSLAHEISHVLRTLTNKDLWENIENAGIKHHVRRTKIAPTDTNEEQARKRAKKKNVGGLYVGSNLQGSEAVGELFSLAVDVEAKGERADVEKIISILKPLIEKAKQNPTNDDYYFARIALLDHLEQLQRLGNGNLHAYNIIALGTFGYTSFEKVPSLIKLGVLNKAKFDKMKSVINTIGNWLTEGSQNT